jgi:hypothetical protein
VGAVFDLKPSCFRRTAVIACDKREAFAQGSTCDEAIQLASLLWIASRSLSSGAHSRDPLARNDGAGALMEPRSCAGKKFAQPNNSIHHFC